MTHIGPPVPTFPILGLLLGLFVVLAVPLAAAQAARPDDTARYLAGFEPAGESPLASLAGEAGWQSHARILERDWDEAERRQLGRVRAWSAGAVPQASPLMLYLFSGPDFLYADAFFPNASTYVLSGLEPVGPVPDVTRLSPAERARALGALRVPLGHILQFSYFITKDMANQLRASKLTGTLPLIYVFLARTGKRIETVSLVSLMRDGTVRPRRSKAPKGASPGVKITFSDDRDRTRTLYYFRTDLSNAGLESSGFMAFCRTLGPADSLLKAASYLLHTGGFTTARGFLLERAATVVQDDSGIPLRYFAPGEWQLFPYGAYYGPIPVFKRWHQPGMDRLFARGRAARVDFGIGYRWPPRDTNILLAVKRSDLPWRR